VSHITHLRKDKKLASIIALQEIAALERRNKVHLHICASIISQQLSTKVAAVIYARFLALFSKKTPSPKNILALPFDELKGIGLSHSKTNYVINVCRFFIDNRITDSQLHQMEDEALITHLTQIKGVGRWTAEMILMFTLAREDVFAIDDLAIQQAMAKLYALDTADKRALKQQMTQISNQWKPYRTFACLYLWGWKDNATK
jgi:DNA-3-methyladenine glycosylase II